MGNILGSMWVGNSGLTTAQNALHTTAHNITNADTVGYTREQILQSTKKYVTLNRNFLAVSNQQYGLGVNYARTEQIRDYFLDQSYRRESGRSAFYETSMNTMNQVEDIFGEMDGAEFKESLSDLWVAVQELAKEPDGATQQSLLVTRCSEFMEHAASVYGQLSDYQDQLNAQVLQKIDKINSYGDRIIELNNSIVKIEAGDVERANDLRDERNRLLDELGGLANITYAEDVFGAVSVRIEENDFVKGDKVYTILPYEDEATGFYRPIWEDLTKKNKQGEIISIEGADVFDLTREISTELNSDIGSLKATVLARGDRRTIWSDVPVEPDASSSEFYLKDTSGNVVYDADGNPKLDENAYNKAYAQYEKDAKTYNETVAQSICMNVMAEFDALVHNVTQSVNQVLSDAAEAGGSYPESTYLRDENGNPLQIFITTLEEPYPGNPKYEAKDNLGRYLFNYDDDVAFYEENKYTTVNLRVNPDLQRAPATLGFRLPDGSADFDTAEKLKTIFTDEKYALNPNVATKTSLNFYYNSLINQVANSGDVYKSIYEQEEATLTSVEEARQTVSGVSTDEELQFMIMFQNAYNASSRYINVINSMLDTLINSLQ